VFWIGAAVRESAGTRSWEKAEEKKRLRESEAEDAASARREGQSPKPKHQAVTIADAITRSWQASATKILESTLGKLSTIFQKQFLSWAKCVGLRYIDELSTAHLEVFRDTCIENDEAR